MAASEEEKETSLINKAPGSPPLTILSFNNAFHGRTMACLNVTHTKWAHKMDFPASDWPIADFPALKYPLSEHVAENKQEEQRCLDMVKDKIETYNRKGTNVAGIIVEPIQCEGGDNYASAEFFQKLQKIIKDSGGYFMVDEVQTGGGATGKWFYHENWDLPTAPDVVSFSKKTQTGGFFHTSEMRQQEAYRIFNTWMGDPSKVIMLEAFVKTVRKENLLASISDVSKYILKGMAALEAKYPDMLSASRGAGSLIACDLKTTQMRDTIVNAMRQNGVNTGSCGNRSLRLRPALIFQQKHADVFLESLEKVLKEHK